MPKPAPVKRKTNWRVWIRIASWSALAALALPATRELNAFLQKDSRFELVCGANDAACTSLEIRGAVHSDRARLRTVFARDYGTSVFRIPLAERRPHLLAVDWVSEAAVSRLWPNRLVVSITERKPAAFAKLQLCDSARYRLGLIDAEGVLLPIPARVRFHLPVLSGVTELQTEPERRERVRAAQNLLALLGKQASDISEVNAADLSNLKVVAGISGQAVELWMGDQRFLERYGHFVSHYPQIRERAADSGIFDLRMDDRILAK